MLQCVKFNFDKRNFLLLFPKVKKINMSLDYNPASITIFTTINHFRLPLILKNNQIQELEDFYGFELYRLLKTCNLCSGLITLTLNGNDIYLGSFVNDITFKFDSMSVLESLTSVRFFLRMYDCEEIHCRTYSLKSLNLINITLHHSELPRDIPTDITPVTSITKLNIETGHSTLSKCNIRWLRYICLKYTNLIHFRYHIYPWHEGSDRSIVAYKALMPFLLQNNSPWLTSLSLSYNLDLNFNVLKLINNSGNQIEELEVDLMNDSEGFQVFIKAAQSVYFKKLDLIGLLPKTDLSKLDTMKYLETSFGLVSDKK